MPVARTPALGLGLAALLVLAACGADAPTSTERTSMAVSPASSSEPTASAPAAVGSVEPAPGSDSVAYPPNPSAIVVAIDPGHGGCLDWGVPDPSERGVELAEKALTLGIAQRLRDRLEADGIGVVMIRDADEALAGDDYPELDCHGPAWRDVDGDGQSGFEESGRIRTRDELQARIDLANLARADAFVSIHINSLTQDGIIFDIAATQTFYDDETPWGHELSAALADGLQQGVVDAIDPLAAHYDRQDRGTEAVAYYAISRGWADGDTCETDGDTWCKPHRALQMPAALAEVGSITLREEHDLLASAQGQDAIAAGLFDGLAAFLDSRDLAGRVDLADEAPGTTPEPVTGAGPPFWAPLAPESPLRLRVTNTGTRPWPAGARLMAGWEASDLPYLADEPEAVAPLPVELPALDPGASVLVEVTLPGAPAEPSVAWIALEVSGRDLTDVGSPALQLSSGTD